DDLLFWGWRDTLDSPARGRTMAGDDSLSQWDRIEKLGEGGNGEVWRARRGGAEYALKILRERSVREESYRRFVAEVDVLRQLTDVPGVLPVVDANLPEAPSKRNPAWLAMPLATGIRAALGDRPPLAAVVEAVASVADSLARLAARG